MQLSCRPLPGPMVQLLAVVADSWRSPCVCTAEYYQDKSGKLGPDPLRSDADGERLWDKMRSSKKPVGGILMDQACVAGIGNIYRAEILFKVGRGATEVPVNLAWWTAVIMLACVLALRLLRRAVGWSCCQLG